MASFVRLKQEMVRRMKLETDESAQGRVNALIHRGEMAVRREDLERAYALFDSARNIAKRSFGPNSPMTVEAGELATRTLTLRLRKALDNLDRR